MCRSKRQTVVRCQINPWRQTEDEGERSMRLAAAGLRSQVGGICGCSLAFLSFSIIEALCFSCGNTAINPVCGVDMGCEKAVKYVWPTTPFFERCERLSMRPVSHFSLPFPHVFLCRKKKRKNDLILNLN